MSVESNQAVVLRFFEALGTKDFAALAGMLDQDFRVWCAGSNWFSGWADLTRMSENAARIYTLFPDGLGFEVKHIVSEGNAVAVEVESNAPHISGTIYHNQYHMKFIVENGKIVLYKEYMDTQLAGQFIGVDRLWGS